MKKGLLGQALSVLDSLLRMGVAMRSIKGQKALQSRREIELGLERRQGRGGRSRKRWSRSRRRVGEKVDGRFIGIRRDERQKREGSFGKVKGVLVCNGQ